MKFTMENPPKTVYTHGYKANQGKYKVISFNKSEYGFRGWVNMMFILQYFTSLYKYTFTIKQPKPVFQNRRRENILNIIFAPPSPFNLYVIYNYSIPFIFMWKLPHFSSSIPSCLVIPPDYFIHLTHIQQNAFILTNYVLKNIILIICSIMFL